MKGAYAEPATITYPKKADVDKAFFRLAERMLGAEGRPVFATHDEVLISYGPAWFPWYMRRLAERPANVWFVLRKMVGL